MQYPDKWLFLYDDETLRKDLDEVDFSKFTSRGDVPLQNWKSIDCSFQEIEKTIQKHYISQVQILLTFFNTEAVCNEYKSFVDYSQQMIAFLKSEMLYCFSFWKFATIKDFVRQRLNSSLVRTYRFLCTLQVNILDKYMREKNSIDNGIELNPQKDCLNDYIDNMLVEHSQIETIMAFFEKAYGELYDKLQKFKSSYESEVNMVGKIFLFSKLFFQFNPKGMYIPLNRAIPRDPEKVLLYQVFKSNDELRYKIEEKAKGPKHEEEENQIENYFVKNIMTSMLVKKLQEEIIPKKVDLVVQEKIDEEKKPVEKVKPPKKSFVAERLRTASKVQEDLEDSPQEDNGSPVLQLRGPITRSDSRQGTTEGLLKAKRSILKGVSAFMHRTSVYAEPEDTSPKSPTKEKEYSSVMDILKKTANNPFQNHLTNPLLTALRSDNSVATLSTAISSVLNGVTSKYISDNYNSPEKALSERSRDDYESSRKISQVHSTFSEKSNKKSEVEDYHNFLEDVLTDGLITAMMEKKLEPMRLQQKTEEQEAEMQKRQAVKFKRNTTRFYTKMEANKDKIEDDQDLNDEDSSPKKRDRAKSKLKEDSIEFDPAILEETNSKHTPYRENRGQDVADEKILGNLMDANLSDDDGQEDDDPELIDFKKERNTNVNRFVTKVKNLDTNNALPPTHFRPNKFLLNLKPYEDICSVRSAHKWSVVHDNLRAAICQKQIFKIRHDDDPTNGLYMVPRHMKYLIRKSTRNKNADTGMKFNTLYQI